MEILMAVVKIIGVGILMMLIIAMGFGFFRDLFALF